MNDKVVVSAILYVQPQKKAEMVEAVTELTAASRSEEGCIKYVPSTSVEEPNTIFIYEEWASQKALQDHMAMPHFTEFVEKAGNMFTAPPNVTQWKEGLDAFLPDNNQ